VIVSECHSIALVDRYYVTYSLLDFIKFLMLFSFRVCVDVLVTGS